MKFGTTELIVILIVVIIIFGPTQIPKLTKMFGKSVEEPKPVKKSAASKKAETAEKVEAVKEEVEAAPDEEK